MSTPADISHKQQSSTATYNHAISLLEGARSSLIQVRRDVETEKNTLQANYGGEDGRAYAQVMATWMQEVERIEHTCRAMEHQLESSAGTSNRAQGAAADAVAASGSGIPHPGSGSGLANDTYKLVSGG
ncbi:hypothetical protein ABZV75_39185 [Streptomyces flaveolus]|uniref:WXG100 family type VII secretion target n=1 Tax=Streptomyces flaveolus TaxID=67297 RepID=UPI00339E21D9